MNNNTPDPLQMTLDEMDISVRLFNALKSNKIKTIRDIVKYEISDIKGLRNFGQKSTDELENYLHSLGLRFGMDLPDDVTDTNVGDIPIHEKTEEVRRIISSWLNLQNQTQLSLSQISKIIAVKVMEAVRSPAPLDEQALKERILEYLHTGLLFQKNLNSLIHWLEELKEGEPDDKNELQQEAEEYAGSNYFKNHNPKIWDERYNAYLAAARKYTATITSLREQIRLKDLLIHEAKVVVNIQDKNNHDESD